MLQILGWHIGLFGELLQFGFQDVVLLPSSASFAPHFLKIVLEVKDFGIATCLNTVVDGQKLHAPCKYWLPVR